MRGRLRRTAIGVLCAACLAAIVVGASLWALAAWDRALRDSPEARMEAELGARLTPQAQGDDPAADALTAEVVVAALEDAGFQCSQGGTDPPELPDDLSGALCHYECEVTMSDGTYRVGVLSYSDEDEARLVAAKANLANRVLRGMRWSALSRGPVVVTVASCNLELVGKLRTILDSVG